MSLYVADVLSARYAGMGPRKLAHHRAYYRARLTEDLGETRRADLAAGLAVVEAELDRRGVCRRCGRALEVSSSVAAGIGPECAELEAAGE